jgi:N6-adenosine-specific RNA methylase IME4
MEKLEIKEEFKKLIPALTQEEFKQLEENCLEEGIREAIITWKGYIIDGHNRYEIANKWNLDFQTKSKHFENEIDVRIWMRNNQKGRRNLTKAWYIELELGNKEDLALKGEKKRIETQGRPSKEKPLSQNDNSLQKHDTRKEIAKSAGVSTGMVGMSEVIKTKNPELWEKAKAGEVTVTSAYKEIKKEEKKEKRLQKIEEVKQKIEADNIIQPNKKYHVIAIDPPWSYKEKGGFSSEDYNSESNRGAVDYPVMNIEQIKNIELPAADDCVLFLWTTHAFLKDSFEIMENWNFDYKATLVWDKVKMGIGRTIRMQVEFCLIGIKGNPIINGSAERDIITEPRREHSRKPEAFYEMVDRMCIGNKLDYFSRNNRNNWEHYGAETNKF